MTLIVIELDLWINLRRLRIKTKTLTLLTYEQRLAPLSLVLLFFFLLMYIIFSAHRWSLKKYPYFPQSSEFHKNQQHISLYLYSYMCLSGSLKITIGRKENGVIYTACLQRFCFSFETQHKSQNTQELQSV